MHATYCAREWRLCSAEAIFVRIGVAIKLNYIYCSNPVTELIKYPVTRCCRFSLGLSVSISLCALSAIELCGSGSFTQTAAKVEI